MGLIYISRIMIEIGNNDPRTNVISILRHASQSGRGHVLASISLEA